MSLLSHVRLAKYFPDFSKRIQCVQSRLQAIAVLGKRRTNLGETFKVVLVVLNAFVL